MNNAKKFITKGNKVKVTLRFRGREMAHMQQSKHILDDFAEMLADVAVIEKPAKQEGRSMSMVLTCLLYTSNDEINDNNITIVANFNEIS